jgi:hypothetical protein
LVVPGRYNDPLALANVGADTHADLAPHPHSTGAGAGADADDADGVLGAALARIGRGVGNIRHSPSFKQLELTRLGGTHAADADSAHGGASDGDARDLRILEPTTSEPSCADGQGAGRDAYDALRALEEVVAAADTPERLQQLLPRFDWWLAQAALWLVCVALSQTLVLAACWLLGGSSPTELVAVAIARLLPWSCSRKEVRASASAWLARLLADWLPAASPWPAGLRALAPRLA